MGTVEVWKPVRNCEGYYEVSNFGNIKVLQRNVGNGHGGRIIKERLLPICQSKDKHHYALVSMCIDHQKTRRVVARVVYESFNSIDLDNKKIIVHKDGNRMNNKLENIKVMTRRNVRQTRLNKSGFVGVTEHTSNEGCYSAKIVFEGKSLNIHTSNDKEECHKIYQLAKAMIDEYDKLKAGILSNSRLNNKIIVKSLPIK